MSNLVCKCDFRQKTAGDGCAICNPELAADYATDTDANESAGMSDTLVCGLCGADAGDNPYHATMDGNGHVHICASCFKPDRHDVAVLLQQQAELVEAFKNFKYAVLCNVRGITGELHEAICAAECAIITATGGWNGMLRSIGGGA